MNIAAINCGSAKFPAIEDMLRATGANVTPLQLADCHPKELNAMDALVLSGGHYLFTDPGATPDIRDRFTFLPEIEAPLLGICLGMQAMAIALGGSVVRGPERRVREKIEWTTDHRLFDGLPSGTEFAEDHCEGVALPEPASSRILAQSEHYPVEAFAATDRPWFGVQFHPEVSGPQGLSLIRNFLALATTRHPGPTTAH